MGPCPFKASRPTPGLDHVVERLVLPRLLAELRDMLLRGLRAGAVYPQEAIQAGMGFSGLALCGFGSRTPTIQIDKVTLDSTG